MAILAIALMVLLFAAGCPIFLCMAIGGSLLIVFVMGMTPTVVASIFMYTPNNFVLIAIPLFIMLGQLLFRGGAIQPVIDAIDAWIGHLPGGLALVTVLTCTVFASFSGSSVGTAAAMGSAMVRPMEEHGYDRKFSMGLIACAGTMAIMIPPSGGLILVGWLTEQSIGELFMAGIVPGLVTALFLAGIAIFICWRRGYGKHPPFSWEVRWRSLGKAFPTLLLPVVILGGIYSGIFTPGEAAAISVLYSLLICLFCYRGLNFKTLQEILSESMKAACMLFVIIGAATLLGLVITYTRIAEHITEAVIATGVGKIGYLMMVNGLFLIMGCLIETTPLVLITVPILYPAVKMLGIDPIHFCIVVVLNIEVAQITPPVGINLYVLTGVLRERVEAIIAGVWPFFLGLLASLVLITYVPNISLILPSILGY